SDLPRRKIHDRSNLTAGQFFRFVALGDLRGGFFPPDLGAEIDHELERGLARFRKRRGLYDRSDAHIHFPEIAEGDFRFLLFCHAVKSAWLRVRSSARGGCDWPASCADGGSAARSG